MDMIQQGCVGGEKGVRLSFLVGPYYLFYVTWVYNQCFKKRGTRRRGGSEIASTQWE